ncbi:response regulator [Rhodocaloribacter litoris]|uniref:response regulator n=1 Tax=Rhodocaloribacter litoris TaxID=2558931 RepID=UPI0014218410|nr:response regulator [Rhodocaloribacter litoris]QXD15546.1 response regulator [Rhodocaloribacter litoris]
MILIVEDNPFTHRLFQYMLDKDYHLRMVSDEETALIMARRARYDLVLMDIHLGTDRTGLDAMLSIRDIEGYEDIPVIAVTAYAEHLGREKLLELGFDEYVPKPFTRRTLVNAIERMLEARKNRDGTPSRHVRPSDTIIEYYRNYWNSWPEEA